MSIIKNHADAQQRREKFSHSFANTPDVDPCRIKFENNQN
jgi:hypothetical protein